MTLNFLRITAVLILLLTGATFSVCPTLAGALVEHQAAGHCCPHEQDEPEQPVPTGDCSAGECGCVTCLVVILSTQELALTSCYLNILQRLTEDLTPPGGYLASIDYPPETV